jgi:hypothetical protein
MTHKLRGQDKNKSEKNKCSFCKHTVRWPVLKAEASYWITTTETTVVLCLQNWLLFKQEDRWFLHGIANFVMRNSWCYRSMKRNGLWNKRQLWQSFKRHSISNGCHSIADDVVLRRKKENKRKKERKKKKVKSWTRLRFRGFYDQ